MRAQVTRAAVVVGEGVAVEVGQQAAVERAQALGRDRLAALDLAVRLELVVGEQHLAVERAGDLVDGVLQQHDPLARIGRPGQHVVEQQRLAERRRHLGDEDRVARIHERLRLVRQHRVHRVAHLVGQREDAVERVVPVEQHVRMHAVHRRRVGAAVLARVLVDVDPALGEGPPDARLVVGAEHRRRLDDPVGDVVVGVAPIELDERDGAVVEVIAVEAEHALAQPLVAPQRLDAGAAGGDEVLDDRRRDGVAVEGGVEHRRRSRAPGRGTSRAAARRCRARRRCSGGRRTAGGARRRPWPGRPGRGWSRGWRDSGRRSTFTSSPVDSVIVGNAASAVASAS